MKVTNIHSRSYPVTNTKIGELLDSLASKEDRLWPKRMWPAMKFDRPLSVGAIGGHKPIQYFVEKHDAGKLVQFCFTAPRGFKGVHRLEVLVKGTKETELRHTIEMNTEGTALLSWPILFRPLHNALVEDALTLAEENLGLKKHVKTWSVYARVLRWIASGGKSSRQSFA